MQARHQQERSTRRSPTTLLAEQKTSAYGLRHRGVVTAKAAASKSTALCSHWRKRNSAKENKEERKEQE